MSDQGMSDQDMSGRDLAETQAAGENRKPSFLDYLTFIAAGVAGSWGLMEILLATDPFVAASFKYLWIITFAALALSFGVWFGATRRIAYGVIALAMSAAAVSAAADHLNPAVIASYAGEGLPNFGSSRFWFAMGGAFALGVAIFAFIARCARLWVRRNVTAPMIVSVLVVGLFAFGLSMGRARDIKTSDIALEELRKAGMGYNLPSLQNALFFVNDRGLKLYRQAGFQPDDILLALGRVSDFSNEEQLVFSILDRTEEDARKRVRRQHTRPYERAERFAAMVRTALADRDTDDPSDGFFETFDRYDASGSRCRGASMPLMSYVIESGSLSAAAALWGDVSGRDLGVTPAPMLYGAEIDWAEDAQVIARALRELTEQADDSDQVAAGAGDAACEGGFMPGRQAHLHGIVGPLFGLAESRAARGDPIGPRDAATVCAIAKTLSEKGLTPVSFIGDELAAAIGDDALDSECKKILTVAPRAPQPEAPKVFEAVERAGYVVRAAPGGACEVGLSNLRLPSNSVRRYTYESDAGEQEIWFSEMSGALGTLDMIGVLQQRDDEIRVILGARGDLRATSWSDAPGSLDAPLIASGAGELVVLHADAASARARIADWFAAYEADRVNLRRGADSEGEGGGKNSGATQIVEGMLRVDAAPLMRRIDSEEEIGVEASVNAAPGDLCLEFRSVGAASSEVLASRFISRGESGRLRLKAMRPNEKVVVFAWMASNQGPTEATISLKATSPQTLDCAPSRAAAEELPASNWTVDSRFEGRVSSQMSEMFCPVSASEASEVTISLTGLSADVDIEVLYAATPGGAMEALASSVEVGATDELINGLFLPGDYMIRVYSADDADSAFVLNIDDVNDAPDIEDSYTPNDSSTAYPIGAMSQGAAPIEVVDAVFANSTGVADWFIVDVTEPGLLVATLDELNADLDLEILNARLESLGSSILGGSSSERAIAVVDAGRYFIKIESAISFGASRYRLGVGMTELQREDLGALAQGGSETRSGELSMDSPQAEFLFESAEPGNVRIRLSGLANDVDVTLESMQGDILGESSNGGEDPELIEQYLAPGSYRVRIRLYEGEATPYMLEISR